MNAKTDVETKPATTGKDGGSGGQGGALEQVLRGLRTNVRQYGMLIALALLLVIFQIWTGGDILLPNNVSNIIQQNGYILILAIGMMIVIINGHIDLSVGSVAGFTGAVASVLMVQHGMPWQLAFILTLLLGAAVGAWHGFWISYVGIPSFIVTLAGMLLFRGLTRLTLDGQSESSFPEGFRDLGTGFLPEVGPTTNYHNLTVLLGLAVCAFTVISELRKRRQQQAYDLDVMPFSLFVLKCAAIIAAVMAFTLTLASWHGAPIVLLILGGLLVLMGFLMRNSVIGRHVYALGGNRAAAQLSGVNSQRVTFLVFVNMGLLSALAGCVFTARLGVAAPGAGELFELEAIAAAFIGGASMSGGVGTVLGAVIGGLVLGVLDNGMSLVGVDENWQQVIKGLVLLAAVAFDIWNKRRATT
ncbi:multiple monosaccharide ABC transporter permease [Streptomyces sp. 7-21]|uniref:multiple monosaccharide ABC transporter permease n=1 Tax=Streptomyces sp. 7-21 TaxID=2802283 RepID=UPI00191CFD68|nr:multiple monosaccharide ABC transporter permease [Streptomyces sp. 7-21]MBL1067654.1 sugar ABC transporter permease [Streptomyces sp. 7-21]